MTTVKQTFLKRNLSVIAEYVNTKGVLSQEVSQDLSTYVRFQMNQGLFPSSVQTIGEDLYVLSWKRAVGEIAVCFITNAKVVDDIVFRSESEQTRRFLQQLQGQPVHVLAAGVVNNNWHLRAEIEGYRTSVSVISP